MSTKIEPVVAHDEKSKFFIFFPEKAYGKPILVTRAYDPSGLQQESRALGATILK